MTAPASAQPIPIPAAAPLESPLFGAGGGTGADEVAADELVEVPLAMVDPACCEGVVFGVVDRVVVTFSASMATWVS